MLTVIFRIIQGLSQSCIVPSMHTAFGKWTPLEERGRLTSFAYGGNLYFIFYTQTHTHTSRLYSQMGKTEPAKRYIYVLRPLLPMSDCSKVMEFSQIFKVKREGRIKDTMEGILLKYTFIFFYLQIDTVTRKLELV